MRKKLYTALNKVYGIMMTVSFFAGILPVLPFLYAIIVGGETAEAITVFCYKQYYPWVIVIGCLAILVGLAAMMTVGFAGCKKSECEWCGESQAGFLRRSCVWKG